MIAGAGSPGRSPSSGRRSAPRCRPRPCRRAPRRGPGRWSTVVPAASSAWQMPHCSAKSCRAARAAAASPRARRRRWRRRRRRPRRPGPVDELGRHVDAVVVRGALLDRSAGSRSGSGRRPRSCRCPCRRRAPAANAASRSGPTSALVPRLGERVAGAALGLEQRPAAVEVGVLAGVAAGQRDGAGDALRRRRRGGRQRSAGDCGRGLDARRESYLSGGARPGGRAPARIR